MAFKDGTILGPVTFNNAGIKNTTIGTGTNTGTVSIGNSNITSISIDCGTAGINVGTTSNAHATTFGSTNSSSSTTIQSGSGALSISSSNGSITANSGTGTASISSDSSVATINLGTGSGAKTVNLGSTDTTSTTILQSGSGGIKIPAFTEGALVCNNSGTLSSVTGTAGHVLTSNGAGNAPSFQAASGGNDALHFLQSQTASSSASITFTSTYINTYKNFVLFYEDVTYETNCKYLVIQVSDDDGMTYKTSGYQSFCDYNTGAGTSLLSSSLQSGYQLSNINSATSIEFLTGFCYLLGLATSSYPSAHGQSSYLITSTVDYIAFTNAQYLSPLTVNNIKIMFDTGNIASGTFSLYGIET